MNTLRIGPEELARLAPFALEPMGWLPEGFLVDPGGEPGKHPYHAAGLYYLQDPSAMAVGALLDPKPGERVLDLAAAPGGKAVHIASRLRGAGLLVANDVHPARTAELIGNLERWGVRNAVVTRAPASLLADKIGPWFDRVLLDAPCSGEAMFHKSEAARAGWSQAAVAGCSRRQKELIRQAGRLVRPGGVLAYSTCAFSPEENEGVVAHFLKEAPEFELEALQAPGGAPGRPDWLPEPLRRPGLERCLRLWPHRHPGAGHFAARFRKKGGSQPAHGRPADSPGGALPATEDLWRAFARENLAEGALPEGRLLQRGVAVYLYPEGVPVFQGVPIERPGLRLGTVRRGRFIPAHALAMALGPQKARRRVDLAAAASETAAYLRGETISSPGPEGWAAISVDGFVLGWGRRVGPVVKNYYPKGLRRR